MRDMRAVNTPVTFLIIYWTWMRWFMKAQADPGPVIHLKAFKIETWRFSGFASKGAWAAAMLTERP